MSQPKIYDAALLPVLGNYEHYQHVDATGYQPSPCLGQSEGVEILHELLKVINNNTESITPVPKEILAEIKAQPAEEYRRYVYGSKYVKRVAYVPYSQGRIHGQVKVYDLRAEESKFGDWSPDAEFNFIKGRPHGLCLYYIKGSANKLFYHMGQLLSEECTNDNYGTYVYHQGQLQLYQRFSPDSEGYTLLQYAGGLPAHQYVGGTDHYRIVGNIRPGLLLPRNNSQDLYQIEPQFLYGSYESWGLVSANFIALVGAFEPVSTDAEVEKRHAEIDRLSEASRSISTFEQQLTQLAAERNLALKRPGDLRIPIFNQFLTVEGKFDGVQEYFHYDIEALEAKLQAYDAEKPTSKYGGGKDYSIEALDSQDQPPVLGLGIKTSFNYGYRVARWYLNGIEVTYQNYLLTRGDLDLNADTVSIIGQY